MEQLCKLHIETWNRESQSGITRNYLADSVAVWALWLPISRPLQENSQIYKFLSSTHNNNNNNNNRRYARRMKLASGMCITILLLLISCFITPTEANNMTFTPSHPLCPGDTVQMVCHIIVPEDSPHRGVFTSAQISFNGSEPTFPTTLDLLDDVDTSRYVGDFKGLDISVERPGAWLNISYIPSDSSILFGCHAFLENIESTEALVTGRMMRPAVPPEDPVPALTTTTLSPNTCSNLRIDWQPVSAERPIESYYVYRNGHMVGIVGGDTSQYTDTQGLTPNREYTYSVAAANCAGNSTAGNTDAFSVKAYNIVNNSLMLSYDTQTGILTADWSLSTGVSGEQLSISLTYQLELNYSYTRLDIHNTNTILFTEVSTNTTISTQIASPISQQNEAPSRISANIKIVKQCGQKWPPGEVDSTEATTKTTTTTTTTTTTSTTYTTSTEEPTVKGSNSATTTTATTTTSTLLIFTYFILYVLI